MKPATPTQAATHRYRFLDEYRGLSIVLMILANYIAYYNAVPSWLKHAKGDSLTLVDLIAPMFLFILGIMFRQSLIKQICKFGVLKASITVLRRYVLLMALGFIGSIVAKGSLHVEWGILQAIGLAGILALPFLFISWQWRIPAGVILLGCYYWVTYPAFSHSILHGDHGGPYACVSWAALIIGATIAGDLFRAQQANGILKQLIGFCVACSVMAIILVVILGLPISKSTVNPSYVMASLALCSLLFIVFYILGEKRKYSIPTLEVLGKNALLLFLIHYVLVKAMHILTLKSASAWVVAVLALTIYLLCFGIAWMLDKKRWYLRL